MLIYHHAHSEFLIETAAGFRILTDPFDGNVGYPMHDVRCDAVTVSHGHGDHSYTDKAKGAQVILYDQKEEAGIFAPTRICKFGFLVCACTIILEKRIETLTEFDAIFSVFQASKEGLASPRRFSMISLYVGIRSGSISSSGSIRIT